MNRETEKASAVSENALKGSRDHYTALLTLQLNILAQDFFEKLSGLSWILHFLT